MSERSPKRIAMAWTLITACALLFSGCEDNPATTGGGTCEHVDADGLVVETADGTVLLHQWEGLVSGEIDVDDGEILAGLQVWFLDADSVRTRPGVECTDHALRFSVADTALVSIVPVPGQPWSFDVRGRAEGETTLRLLVEHGDHIDFTSQPLPLHVHHHEGGHSEPEGVVLLAGGVEVVRVAEGTVSGSLSAFVAASTSDIDVLLLDAEGDTFLPDDAEIELRVEIDDENVATAQIGPGWSFRVGGVTVGSTALRIVVWHDGHADFTSASIGVEVVESSPIGALILTDGPDWAASDGLGISGAWGPVLVPLGVTRASLRVEVPVVEGLDFRATTYLRLPTGHRLEWTVADPTRVSIARTLRDPMGLSITGIIAGVTTVQLRVVSAGATIYTSSPIPVVVFAPGATDPEPTFQLRLNGRTELGVVDGVLQSVDAQVCGSKVWTDGFVVSLSHPNGPLTDLVGIRVFDDTCTRVDYSDTTHHLAFFFSEPGIARTTHHPEHLGERLVFHVEGVRPGTTTLTLALVQTATSQVVFVSPPLPVTITE